MAQSKNYLLAQGEDLLVKLIYKEGTSEQTATAVDLSTGYAVRMDIVSPKDKTRIYSLKTRAEDDPTTKVSVISNVLSSGAGGTPNIVIQVPRSLTLPGGALYTSVQAGVKVFTYDVFVRNLTADQQFRVIKGSLTVDESSTLWS